MDRLPTMPQKSSPNPMKSFSSGASRSRKLSDSHPSEHLTPFQRSKQVEGALKSQFGHREGERVFKILKAEVGGKKGFESREKITGRKIDQIIGKVEKEHSEDFTSGEIDHMGEILHNNVDDRNQ